jgi:putative ABC transport system ATP-binding protein
MAEMIVRSSDVSFAYPGQKPLIFPDVNIEKGQHTLLLGQSGSGKTTLLQIIAGIRKPSSGEVVINGTSLNSLSSSSLDQFRGRHIGIIYQTSHFIKAINVLENIKLAQSLAGLKIDEQKIKLLLDRLGIADKASRPTYKCSIGEQQRAAIARALAVNPSIILADEPTSALDDQRATQVLALLKEQAELSEATLLVVTHDSRVKDQFTHKIEL